MRWIATDRVAGDLAEDWRDPIINGNTLALLQYTSGSTADPKGVMISHGNLLHNSAYINRLFDLVPNSVTVTWLPFFHDMGLTNGIIQPVYKGGPCYLMPAAAFLMRPVRWLHAISRYKATISGGPNFAYDLCVAEYTRRTACNAGSQSLGRGVQRRGTGARRYHAAVRGDFRLLRFSRRSASSVLRPRRGDTVGHRRFPARRNVTHDPSGGHSSRTVSWRPMPKARTCGPWWAAAMHA